MNLSCNSITLNKFKNFQDTENGFLMNVNKQIDYVCDKLNKDVNITNAGSYNSIGFSQGGQFL